MARTKPQRNIIRKPAVRVRTGLSDSQIWRIEGRGEFPARVQVFFHS
jgi:predicted DNA-binding transcriptional regulator AlpA